VAREECANAGMPHLAALNVQCAGLDFEGSEKKKPVYFEWAKKVWETEDTFKLPDGTHWPYVSPSLLDGTTLKRRGAWGREGRGDVRP